MIKVNDLHKRNLESSKDQKCYMDNVSVEEHLLISPFLKALGSEDRVGELPV